MRIELAGLPRELAREPRQGFVWRFRREDELEFDNLNSRTSSVCLFDGSGIGADAGTCDDPHAHRRGAPADARFVNTDGGNVSFWSLRASSRYFDSNPNTATPLFVPTYTLPFAIIGVTNLLPGPNWSRPPASTLL